MLEKIHWLGHASFRIEGEQVIYMDPWKVKDGEKADLILITHSHPDHCSPEDVAKIQKDGSEIVTVADCASKLSGVVRVVAPGDRATVQGVPIEAVPAYNIVNMRSNGNPYHPKGRGNGYVLTFGDTRVYVAGDTENTPEMKALRNIDVAFLPMNLPYTMSAEMVADAAKAFRPGILYPYHYGETVVSELVDLLAGVPDIEVRIRELD